MTYDESVRSLLSLGRELAAPRQARVQKFGLENTFALAEALGHPERSIPCAHIAGTNGKGSTAAMFESILRAAGLRTGLYTSPHLERVNERIRVNGEDISDADFAAAFTRVRAAIESLLAAGELAAHPSFFECVTAMAFVAFAEQRVDFAIYEVGMGGRLDATNIVRPEVAVITSIDFDHENYLGHSIEEIASEKAGIIKPGGWVVSAAERPEAREVIARRCHELGARLVELDAEWKIQSARNEDGRYHALAVAPNSETPLTLAPSLAGRFQLRNALAAAAAARVLVDRGFAVPDSAVEQGIAAARWPGRLEQLCERPAVYLDGAHNPAAARELVKFWEENFAARRILLVYGAMRDKALDEIAGLLFAHAEFVIFTEPRQQRAISAAHLAEMAGHLAEHSAVVRDPVKALERAIEIASPEDAVFATGSLFLVGDLRRYWTERNSSKAGAHAATAQADSTPRRVARR